MSEAKLVEALRGLLKEAYKRAGSSLTCRTCGDWTSSGRAPQHLTGCAVRAAELLVKDAEPKPIRVPVLVTNLLGGGVIEDTETYTSIEGNVRVSPSVASGLLDADDLVIVREGDVK